MKEYFIVYFISETFRFFFFQVYVVGGLYFSHKTSLKMMKVDFKVEEKH